MQVSSNTQLGTCILEVALCLSQQLLLADGGADSNANPPYTVGESVMARRMDGDYGEGTVLDALGEGTYLIVWNDEEAAAKLDAAELMPFGSGMGLSTERRQRVAHAAYRLLGVVGAGSAAVQDHVAVPIAGGLHDPGDALLGDAQERMRASTRAHRLHRSGAVAAVAVLEAHGCRQHARQLTV